MTDTATSLAFMPSEIPVGDLQADTEPTPVDGIDGRYSIALGQAWKVIYAFGGATMTSAIRAGLVEADRDDLRLVSADATYIQAVPAGNLACQVEILRQGRNGAQVLIRLWGTDDPTEEVRTDLLVTVILGKDREGLPLLNGCTLPDEIKDPLDCEERPAPPADSPWAKVPFHHQTDWRQTGGRPIWGEDLEPGKPEVLSWFKLNKPALREDGTWEPASLAVPGDILGPAVVAGVGRKANEGFFMITLQLSMQWFAPVKGEWLLQHTRANQASDGFATGVAELWSEDRELVALCTQCAYLQPMA